MYLIVCLVTGKRYIGKSKRDLEKRWYEHVYHAHTMSTKMVLYAAIRKHGSDAFEKSVLQEGFANVAEMNEAEKQWIAELKPEYNMTAGGDGLEGYNHTSETKAKMSEARKGAKNHNYGKKWGRSGSLKEITKQRISEAKKGVAIHSEAYKQRLAEERYVKVAQFDLNGNHLTTFFSMKHAAEELGITRQGIGRACGSPIRTAGGYKWKLDSEGKR